MMPYERLSALQNPMMQYGGTAFSNPSSVLLSLPRSVQRRIFQTTVETTKKSSDFISKTMSFISLELHHLKKPSSVEHPM
jgi:hypothetical protein